MNENKENKSELENIVEHNCGKRLCKCGSGDCEYAADFFDENGHPTEEFGQDDDLLENQNLEAAEDFSEYAERTGNSKAATENGEIKYRNTARYKMIDPSDDSADSSKS